MKALLSALLWSLGFIFFVIMFIFVSLSILIMPPRIIYPVLRIKFRLLLLIIGLRLKILGRERFDPRKTYLIMGNHESLFDIFAIPAAVPMYFVGVEAAHHFNWKFWGWVVKKWGNIPIPRKRLEEAIQSLEIARKTLESGISIGILPEGTRTLTGKMGAFKKGPFHLAIAAKATILPFALAGLYEFKSKHSWLLNPGTAYVNFGKPIPYEKYAGMSVEELRDYIFKVISQLRQEIDEKRGKSAGNAC